MQSSSLFTLISIFAATASAQSTATATVLLPDWCVTDRNPSVTAWEQGGLTTYSYSCFTDSSAMSSASAKATGEAESARNRASEVLASIGRPQETNKPDQDDKDRRSLNHIFEKRDDDTCYGWGGALNVCIPWEITQGPSIWAVHYTATNVAALDQECSFGKGGVAAGPATCTASGRLDPKVWGAGNGIRTHIFDSHEINWYWIRDVVVATAGAPAATGAGATTGSFQGDSANRAATVTGAQSTAIAAPLPIPSGAIAMLAGAGGILAAALAL